MKLKELIEKVKEEKPNSFTVEKLISFVNEVEYEVAEQLNIPAIEYTSFYELAKEEPTADTWNNGKGWYIYENGEYIEQTNESMSSEKIYYVLVTLLAEPPYDRLYASYVKAQIDYANEEYGSYQNNQMQHTQDFRDYMDWVIRTKQAAPDESVPTKLINIM